MLPKVDIAKVGMHDACATDISYIMRKESQANMFVTPCDGRSVRTGGLVFKERLLHSAVGTGKGALSFALILESRLHVDLVL